MRFLNKILYTAIVLFCSIHISVAQRGGATNPTITVETVVTHLTNEISSGEIDYEVTVSTGWIRGTQINSLEVLDSDGQSVYEHSGSGPIGIVTGLSIGAYKFTGSITVKNSSGYFVSVNFNHTLWVGLEAKWCDSKDMNVAFDNTITRNSTILNYAGARSNNILQSGDGWIQLNAVYGAGEDAKSYLVLGNTQDLTNFSPSGSFQYVEFYSTSSGEGIRVNYQSSPGVYSMTTISNNPNDVVRLIREGSSIKIELNNSITSSFNFPTANSGILNIGVFSNEIGDGFQNVVTSMPGGSALASWDGDLNTGIINVDISDLGIAGPYSYFVTEGVLPNKIELYNFIQDSIGVNLNESDFLEGEITATNYQETGLNSDTYVITVFDNNGVKIFSDLTYVQPHHSLLSSQNLTVEGRFLKANEYFQSYGSLDLFMIENIESDFQVRVLDSNGNGFFGVAPSNITPNNYTQLTYGFYFSNGIVSTVKNGELSNSQAYTENDILKIRNINNQLSLELSSNALIIDAFPSGLVYKTSIGLSKGVKAELIGKGGGKGSVFIAVDTHFSSCFGAFGSIEVIPSVSSSSVVILATRLILDGLSVDNVPGNDYLFENLIPGLYLVEVDYNVNSGSTQTQQEYVLIESTINWANYVSTTYTQVNEGLTRNASGSSLYGAAKANHKLTLGDNTVYFRLSLPGSTNWTGVNWSDQIYSSSNLNTMIEGVVFVKSSGSIIAIDLATSNNYAVVSSNRFIYSYNNGTAVLRKSLNLPTGPTVLSHSVSYTEPKFNVFPGLVTSGIYDVLTDMLCNIPAQYAEVKRKITGVKYKVYLNKVLFYMNEEYLDDNQFLSYKVYNFQNRVSPELSGQTALVENDNNHGDNRYSLDVTALAAGVYLLEVENQKKEKFYLRFIK